MQSVIRCFVQEQNPLGKVAGLWMKLLEDAALQQTDVAAGFSELLAVKDAVDVQKVKKAAFLAASAMKNFSVGELERAAPPLASKTPAPMLFSNLFPSDSQKIHYGSGFHTYGHPRRCAPAHLSCTASELNYLHEQVPNGLLGAAKALLN